MVRLPQSAFRLQTLNAGLLCRFLLYPSGFRPFYSVFVLFYHSGVTYLVPRVSVALTALLMCGGCGCYDFIVAVHCCQMIVAKV